MRCINEGSLLKDSSQTSRKGEMSILMGIERIPDQQGYLVISPDGAILASGGDLENDERLADKLFKLVSLASRVPLSADQSQYFKRVSVTYEHFTLMMTVCGQRIYVVKRPIKLED